MSIVNTSTIACSFLPHYVLQDQLIERMHGVEREYHSRLYFLDVIYRQPECEDVLRYAEWYGVPR